jgi:hypothetical protein
MRFAGYGKSVTPTAGSLEDPWARLRRADHHLKVLENKYGFARHLQHHPVRPKMHRDGLEYRFYLVEPVPEIDECVPFIISELLLNLRAALDHLVYQLHVRRFRGNLTWEAERYAMFPILDDAEVRRRGNRCYDTSTWNEIKRLSERDRTAIEQFQPYITRNDRLKDTRHMLNLLAILNNIDKHRRLHVIRKVVAAVSVANHFPAGRAPRQTFYFRDLVAGAYVERWTFDDLPDAMDVQHYCWPQIVLDEPSLDIRVLDLPTILHRITAAVVHVVSRFNTRFGYEAWRNFRHPTDWRAPRHDGSPA